MSGEAVRKTLSGPESLDRAFGSSAQCNRCAEAATEYRVIGLFLHDTAVVRAYCGACYDLALEGEAHGRGDGMVMDFASFAARFGAPGPPPPRATAVDQVLAALLSARDVIRLAPATECLARRRGPAPYAIEIELASDPAPLRARFRLAADGAITDLEGDAKARGRIKALAGC